MIFKKWVSIKAAAFLIFICIAVYLSFFEPFKADAVFEAIPATAEFSHKSQNPMEFLASPVGRQFSHAFGSELVLEELCSTPELDEWMQQLFGTEFVVASVPSPGNPQQKALIVSSWIGWRSPWLRWRLGLTAKSNGWTPLRSHSVWPVWAVAEDFVPANMELRCSLTDKLFIVCLSGNSSDIGYILDTYDKRFDAVNHTNRENLQ